MPQARAVAAGTPERSLPRAPSGPRVLAALGSPAMASLPDPSHTPRGERASAAQYDRDFVARAVRQGIVAAVVGGAVLALLFVLKAALTPLAAAFVTAYLLDPLIDRLERLGLRRRRAILVVLLAVGVAVSALLFYVVPSLVGEIYGLAQRLPGYIERLLVEGVPALEGRLGIELPKTFEEILGRLRGVESTLLARAGDLLTATVATVTGTLSALVGLLVVPILAFYLLADFDDLLARSADWIPPRHRAYVVDKAHTANRLISSFLRGQLTVAAALGVLYAVGYSVIGVDLAVGVGLLAGVLSIVPYLGGAVAVLTSSVLCVLEFGFDWHLGAALGWYVAVQTFEGFVLTPRIVGESVGLHPAVVIVALLIGGDLFGFLGLLVAVPLAAVVKVFVDEGLALYRRSAFFGEPPGEGDAPAGAPEPPASP
jgi:predicted PurR-regulated permease PerM